MFGRCALVAKFNRELDMKDVIGSHKLDSVPRSIMSADGSLNEGHVNKHILISELTNDYTTNILVSEPGLQGYCNRGPSSGVVNIVISSFFSANIVISSFFRSIS